MAALCCDVLLQEETVHFTTMLVEQGKNLTVSTVRLTKSTVNVLHSTRLSLGNSSSQEVL